MVYTIDQIRKIVAPIAASYGVGSLSLFGSYARGEATDGSDIDILVDSGLPGLTGLLVFLLYNFWNFRHLGNPYELIGFCAWVGFCAVGLFDYTLGMSAAVKALWFMTGCCMRLRETV